FTAQSIRGPSVFISGTGSVSINSNGGSLATSNVPTLSISGSGRLNLTDNDLVVNYSGTSPLTQIKGNIISGYNGGSWNGVGLTSSAAATVPATSGAVRTALGYAEATDLFTTFNATF